MLTLVLNRLIQLMSFARLRGQQCRGGVIHNARSLDIKPLALACSLDDIATRVTARGRPRPGILSHAADPASFLRMFALLGSKLAEDISQSPKWEKSGSLVQEVVGQMRVNEKGHTTSKLGNSMPNSLAAGCRELTLLCRPSRSFSTILSAIPGEEIHSSELFDLRIDLERVHADDTALTASSATTSELGPAQRTRSILQRRGKDTGPARGPCGSSRWL